MTEKEFKTLIASYAGDMWRMANAMLHDSDESSDVVQDVFTKLWELSDRTVTGNLRAYCITSVHRRCIDILRRRQARHTEDLTVCTHTPADTPGPDDILEHHEKLGAVESLLKSLPRNQQTVIRLSAYNCCSNEDISRITGFSDENVRALLSRGRRKLRELLTKQTHCKK